MKKALGSRQMRAHEAGERLTMKGMILAKCYECCGNYADGKEDCCIPGCPLYPMMPYGTIRRSAVSRILKQGGATEAKMA